MLVTAYILATVLLIVLNAFFVLAEFAAVSIRGSRIEELVDQGRRGAKLVQHVHHHLDEYLSMCQVGITFASIALGSVGERVAADVLIPLLSHAAGSLTPVVAHSIATGVAVVLVSFLHILLGEQVPKLMAIRASDSAALWTARPLVWSRLVFYPPLWVLNTCSTAILRLLGFGAMPRHEQHSEDELRIILARSQSGGLLSFRRLLFMENIFDLGDLKVRDAMRPRSEVRTLSSELHWLDAEQSIRTWRFSRYPLITDDPERPVGIIHVKDLLLDRRPAGTAPDLKALARPYLTAQDTAPLESLLSEMQRRRIHIALVFSQGGRWVGLLTMEDIIEEIIGTVRDEFEAETPISLAETLTLGRIVLGVEAVSIPEAIRASLARVPPADLPLPAEQVARAVLERERLASTYLGRGLAMPHARLPGLERPLVVVVRSDLGVRIEGTADKARLFFILLTPAGQPRVHQRLQARIAELLENSDYVEERLHKVATPAEMLEVIRTGEQAAID